MITFNVDFTGNKTRKVSMSFNIESNDLRLQQIYHSMYEDAKQYILKNNCDIDTFLNSKVDSRLGITLKINLPSELKKQLTWLYKDFKKLLPAAYFYPVDEVHITVLSIISCYEGFTLSKVPVNEYITLIKNCLTSYSSFTIEMKGITLSPSCIMLQGFSPQDILFDIREALRIGFRESGIEHSIDSRYRIETLHSTIVRFTEPIQNIKILYDEIDTYNKFNFGTFEVTSLELVCNDWYHRKTYEKSLAAFILNQLK